MTNEEHGREFLEYVAKNEAKLKKNLRKNITYNPELFDDVFQDTIIKVHNAIMKGQRIDDFEKYFFIASKFQYINEDNKDKKRKQNSDNEFIWRLSHGYESKNGGELTMDAQRLLNVLCVDDNEWKDKEDMNDKINELFKFLSKRLNEVFTPAETDIFLIYYRLKSEKAGISYQKMAKITERKFQEIASIIQKIKLFVKNDEEINEYKKKILK